MGTRLKGANNYSESKKQKRLESSSRRFFYGEQEWRCLLGDGRNGHWDVALAGLLVGF